MARTAGRSNDQPFFAMVRPLPRAPRYRRRRPADSRLDPDRTLAEQFELLRVVDNDRYPAFFEWRGRCYEVKINQQKK